LACAATALSAAAAADPSSARAIFAWSFLAAWLPDRVDIPGVESAQELWYCLAPTTYQHQVCLLSHELSVSEVRHFGLKNSNS
jgi:hypothetical protein